MAHPQIAAFARLADGSAKPIRSIAGQNSLITRDIHDMGYDPIRDEIVVVQVRLGAIMTFRGDADGEAAPLRMIMGPKTQLGWTMGRLALDPVHREIFVPSDRNAVLVFPQDAAGDVEPIRILKGPDTQLGAAAIAVDPVHNLLIVSGRSPSWQDWPEGGMAPQVIIQGTSGLRGTLENGSAGQIAIFDRTASGNTKPRGVITGPKTLLSSPQALMVTYPPRGWILGTVGGSDYGEIAMRSTRSFVGVWSIYDKGDVAPRWTIGGPQGILRQARGVTLDPKHKTIIVSDKYLNAVLSFEFPEIF